MTLDALAVLAMSDRLFSSAKLLLTDRRSRLQMDEACECLRVWYGPPPAKKLKTFDEEATDQHKIDQGYMALTVLMARIVVSLLVIGKMGFLMLVMKKWIISKYLATGSALAIQSARSSLLHWTGGLFTSHENHIRE